MSLTILLAAYGSRHAGSAAALEAIRERVLAAHPGAACELAYTSEAVRGHLNGAGRPVRSVPEALEDLARSGAERLAVQSLHIVPGAEYEGVLAAAAAFQAARRSPRLAVGAPLLAGEEDVERVAAILADLAPTRGADEIVLYMGHGTAHPGNIFYDRLSEALDRRDPAVRLGCLESDPCIRTLRDRFLAEGVRRVHLLPFLFGAGFHASQDLCGDGPASWRTVLSDAGIACETRLKGAGEHQELVDVWLDHLAEAVRRLER